MITAHSNIFKLLGDQTRLRIILLLLDGEICVCDLMVALNAPQSTISRQIAKLRAHGLVNDRRDGKWVHYSIPEDGPISQMKEYLDSIRNSVEFQQDRLKLQQHLLEKKC